MPTLDYHPYQSASTISSLSEFDRPLRLLIAHGYSTRESCSRVYQQSVLKYRPVEINCGELQLQKITPVTSDWGCDTCQRSDPAQPLICGGGESLAWIVDYSCVISLVEEYINYRAEKDVKYIYICLS